MSKYKVGDKVFLEAEIRQVDTEPYVVPYNVRFLNGATMWAKESDILTKTYEDGLNDAWELVRKVYGMEAKDFNNVFGYVHFSDVFCYDTPQEALAKIEAYKESKAIKVGDVVETGGNLAVVVSFGTFKVKDDSIHVVYFDGVTNCLRKDNKSIKKTGRHIDIEHLLEQIRGNE